MMCSNNIHGHLVRKCFDGVNDLRSRMSGPRQQSQCSAVGCNPNTFLGCSMSPSLSGCSDFRHYGAGEKISLTAIDSLASPKAQDQKSCRHTSQRVGMSFSKKQRSSTILWDKTHGHHQPNLSENIFYEKRILIHKW